MEIDKFGRTRALNTTSSAAAAAAVNFESIRLNSKIQDLWRNFETKHFDKLKIDVESDEVNIRIRNILVDEKSDDKDAANVQFVKQHTNSMLKSLENRYQELLVELSRWKEENKEK